MKENFFENLNGILLMSCAAILTILIPLEVLLKSADTGWTFFVSFVEVMIALITYLFLNSKFAKRIYDNGWLYFFVIGLMIVIVSNRIDFWTTLPALLIANSCFVGYAVFIYARVKTGQKQLTKVIDIIIAVITAFLVYQLPHINDDPNKAYGYFGFLLAVAIISHFTFIKNHRFEV
jgi:UDP-N-acetylmuramyl pentapeptide phosphotransferase/UDP-N-acetylglucosamine-1-phosphate transferase